MSKVTASVATVQAELPVGITAGLLRFNLLDGVGAIVSTQDIADITVVFTAVPDGSFQVQVARLDTTATVIGAFVTSDPFDVKTVVVAPAFYDAPSALTITVSAD